MPGASAAVVIPGEGIWTGSSGVADIRAHRPVTDRTLFAAGSITKTFVAALMLKLVERDVLHLDDRLSRWVPEFPNSRQITLRQLLNHTSGTSDFVDEPAFAAAQERSASAVWTPRRTLRYAQDPAREPGVDWIYSNTNYILAGLVIERATRSTVARELHRRLLDRSQFPRIVLQGDERPRDPVAVGYQNLDDDTDSRTHAEQRLCAQHDRGRPPPGRPAACSPAPKISRAPATACSAVPCSLTRRGVR